jgi:hypothetical protein
MPRSATGKIRAHLLIAFTMLCALAVPLVVASHQAWADSSASDNFSRANGSLGPDWTDISDGGMVISSQAAAGGSAGVTGDMWAANSFGSDQFSQVTLTGTQLTGAQWIGPAVRMQASGQDAYVGFYNWNGGNPELMLFLRNNGGWAELGAIATSPLAAGTQLQLTAVGNSLSFAVNGAQVIGVSDGTLTGGAPGIMSYGTGSVASWSGGNAGSSGSGGSGGGATYSVGGTVSGLSGTVVLQDNGGDTLSVDSDGSFTFATPLAAGASYNVTVASYPAGETCSIADGSGTTGAADVTSVAVTCVATASAATASDDFGRANGSLGPNWTATSDGGMVISSQAAVGGSGADSGDMWTANTFSSGQFSQVTLTATQLTGAQWIGPTVRMQASGQDGYVGFYYWNGGSPELMLFLRNNGGWGELGAAATAPLAAGTQLQLTAVGNSLSFTVNGTQVIGATDGTLTGGAPGIMSYGTGSVASWSGGNAGSGGSGGSGGATYSVGGTVSGLSGTVVLQDNGGDTLSVGSDGSFTFATPLAAGASYNVTVASYPAGQTCSVADGSGAMGAGDVTDVAVSCSAHVSGSSGSDDFDRANGSLGPNWTATSDGGLVVSSQAAAGGSGGVTGDMWAADSFGSDQFSQVTLTATQLTGGQWIGPAVRMQASGQDAYLGFYSWNGGSPELMLFLRNAGGWVQLGAIATAPLAAGSQLQLTAVGNSLSFAVNGAQVIGVSDGTLTGGAPGIISYGTGSVASWSGGNAGFQVSRIGTSASGITSYNVLSANNGYGPQTLRVLQPTNPAPGVAHNFLIVLPVEAGLGTQFGDGLATMQALDAEDQYNLTIIEPTFNVAPWYANSATDPNRQYETFMTNELVPWIRQNLSVTGHEQIWLIGFSKSGVGAQDLILRNPSVFTLAATWDFPADISSISDPEFPDASVSYGTQANFQANYQLTQAFVQAHAAPFQAANRIWIGGYSLYQGDVSDYGALLTSAGVQHTVGAPEYEPHTWNTGWGPGALAGLYADSLTLPSGSG